MPNNFKRTAHHSLQIDFTTGTRTVENTPSITPEPWPPAPPPPLTYWLSLVDVPYTWQHTILFDNDDNIIFDAAEYDSYATYVIKFNGVTGDIIWQDAIGQVDEYWVQRGAIDNNNNYYALYGFDRYVSATRAMGIIKLDTDGAAVWQKAHPRGYPASPDPTATLWQPKTLRQLSSGNLIMSINSDGPLSKGPGYAIVSLSGALISSVFYNIPAGTSIAPTYMAVNASDEVVQLFDVNSNSPYYNGKMAAKFDAAGAVVWSKYINHTNSEFLGVGQGAAIDSTGASYYAYYNGDASKGAIVKLDTNGNPVYEKRITNQIANIAVDSLDNLYVLDTIGTIFAFDSTGAELWKNQLNSLDTYPLPQGLAIDESAQAIAITVGLDSPRCVLVAKVPLDGSGASATVYTLNGFDFTYNVSAETVSSATPTVSSYTLTPNAATYFLTTDTTTPSATSYTATVEPLV